MNVTEAAPRQARHRRIVRTPQPRAVETVARVRRELGIRDLADIDVLLIGAYYGLAPIVRDLENEEAHLLHAGARGVVCLSRRLWETGAWRFPFAHELGHWLFEDGHDDFGRITATKKTRSTRAAESGASDFAGLLLVPEDAVTARFDLTEPDLDTVVAIARACSVGVSVAAIRVLQMTQAARAVAFSIAGRVEWWAETSAFGARVRAGRRVPRGSEAARLHAGSDRAADELAEGESWDPAVPESAVRVEDGVAVSWLGG